MGGSGRDGLILGIESSCDETAAAVVRSGREVLASVVASQMTLHAEYGGVVPELASREHLKNIVPVVREAMRRAAEREPGLTFGDLDAVAVTEGPGLAGALLVGITYAKALAAGLEKPVIGVNHLEGHIHAVLMQGTGIREQGTGPLMALVVSGGHTHLYLCTHVSELRRGAPSEIGNREQGAGNSAPIWRYRNVGRTVDDAAGEAFDKVAKLLGLGYPGGPWMDALAKLGNARAVEFRFGPIRRKSANNVPPTHSAKDAAWIGHAGTEMSFDFSFSGIKTAVLRYVQTHGMKDVVEARRVRLGAALRERPGLRADEAVREMPEVFDQQTLDLIASFQAAVVGNLLKQTAAAAEYYGARGVIVSGGVSANSELRKRFSESLPLLIDFQKWAKAGVKRAPSRDFPVFFPTPAMATDNAAMIAAAAWGKFAEGEFAGDEMRASPGLRLG